MLNNKKVVFSKEMTIELWTEEFDENKLCGSEVVIKNHYSFISSGTELACLYGKEASWFKFPEVPGYCSAGEIIAKGADVSGFSIGDMVFYYGGHRLYNVIDLNEEICIRLIDGLKPEYAPFARIATIAITSLRQSDIELGDYVIVAGLGAVGNMAAQLAQLQGAKVIGFDLDKKRLLKAKECGIDCVHKFDNEGIVPIIEEVTSGHMADSFIDATGRTATTLDFLPAIKKGGEAILLGTPRDSYMADATKILRAVHLIDSNIKFKSALEWNYPVKHSEFIKHSFESNTHVVFELIRDNKLKIAPFITHFIKPEQAEEAYNGLINNPNEYLGVMFDWK